MLTHPEKRKRNHIERKDVKRWSKHLNVTPIQLSAVMEKVGNSAAAAIPCPPQHRTTKI
jgi:Protein of unknown function (DUF3606)